MSDRPATSPLENRSSLQAISPAVSIQYIRHIAALLKDSGADVGAWLRNAGLAEDALKSPTAALTLKELHQLVSEAMRLHKEPALGLLVGERLRANTHGVLGFAAMQAHTMREALHILQVFVGVRMDLIELEVVQREQECWLLVREPIPLGHIRLPVLEAVMLAIKHLVEFVGRDVCHVIRVEFSTPEPTYSDFAQRCFHCDVRYNAGVAAVVMPLAAVDMELSTSDPEALKSATLLCEKTLQERQGGHSLQSRVRELLLNNQGDFPSLEIAARLLGLTSRTLHRRLVDEGTSYSELLDAVRHQLALEFLRSQRVGLKEIAFRLGYCDMANFRRAFKRWEGCAPSQFSFEHATKSNLTKP